MKKSISLLTMFLFSLVSFSQRIDSEVIECVKDVHTNKQFVVVPILKCIATQNIERIKSKVEREDPKGATNTGSNTPCSLSSDSQEDEPIVCHVEDNTIQNILRRDIYGKNIFDKRNLPFATNIKIPTSVNHKFLAGDEVINILEASQASFRRTIYSEDSINIDDWGTISSSGMTIEEKKSSNDLLKLGCEIIVLTKEIKERMTRSQIIVFSSSFVSMGSVVVLSVHYLTK